MQRKEGNSDPTIPAMQKHTHMMKRTLGCPALRTGTVGYQLSPHTHTQQHHTLDYYNSTPYMYLHKMWSFCRADVQGCFYSTLQGHRPHTCMYMYIAQHVHNHNYLLVVLHVVCTLQVMDVKDSPQNCAYRIWGFLHVY